MTSQMPLILITEGSIFMTAETLARLPPMPDGGMPIELMTPPELAELEVAMRSIDKE